MTFFSKKEDFFLKKALGDEDKERAAKKEKIKKILELVREKLINEGVPADENCRIKMEAFEGVYPKEEILDDKIKLKRIEKKWQEANEPGYAEALRQGEPVEKIEKIGEQLEILKTALFNKFLGKKALIVRTSLYDDVTNHVDNLMIDKETGKTLCAFDEVGTNIGPIFTEKMVKVLKINTEERGAKLKYGLKLEKEINNENKIKLGGRDNLPIFYLALPSLQIKEAIKNAEPSLEKFSDYEKKVFEYFYFSIISQVKALNLEKNLSEEIVKDLAPSFLKKEHFEK